MSATVVDVCGYVLPAAELLYESADGPLRGHWPQLEARWLSTKLAEKQFDVGLVENG